MRDINDNLGIINVFVRIMQMRDYKRNWLIFFDIIKKNT